MTELRAPLKSNCFSYSLAMAKHFQKVLITQKRHFKCFIKLFAQERIFANNLDANSKNVENPAGLNLLQLILIASSQKNSYHCRQRFLPQ